MNSQWTLRQRIAAYGLAVQHENVLLVREPQSQRWWLPGGGVDFGEAPQECMAREFEEEVGVAVVGSRLVDVVSDVGKLSTEQVELHSVRIIYEVRLDPAGQLRQEADGSTDSPEWIPLVELGRLPMPPWLCSYLHRYVGTLARPGRH